MTERQIIVSGATVAVTVEGTQIPATVAASTVGVVAVRGPAGSRGAPGTSLPVFGEVPAELPDGGRTVFTLANNYVSASVAVYRNGIRQLSGYVEWPPNQVAFDNDDPPLATDAIAMDYLIA